MIQDDRSGFFLPKPHIQGKIIIGYPRFISEMGIRAQMRLAVYRLCCQLLIYRANRHELSFLSSTNGGLSGFH